MKPWKRIGNTYKPVADPGLNLEGGDFVNGEGG